LLPLGWDLMPLVVLAVGGIWYVPTTLYSAVLLSAMLMADSMRGLEALPTVRSGLILVTAMIILQQVNLNVRSISTIRRLVLAILVGHYLLQLMVAYPLTLHEAAIHIVLSIGALLLWWGLLHLRVTARLDQSITRSLGSAL
jgi:hypothetical protein